MDHHLSPIAEMEGVEEINITPSPPLETTTQIRKRHNSLPSLTESKRTRTDDEEFLYKNSVYELDLLRKNSLLEILRMQDAYHFDTMMAEKQAFITYLQTEINTQTKKLETKEQKIHECLNTIIISKITNEVLKIDHQQTLAEAHVECNKLKNLRAADLQHIGILQKENCEITQEVIKLRAKEEANNIALDERINFLMKAQEIIKWHQTFANNQTKNQEGLINQMKHMSTGLKEYMKQFQENNKF